MSERMLVTGGAGCIGSELCGALLARGHDVRVLDNLSSGRLEHIEQFLSHPRFQFLHGDLLDEKALESALDEVEFVHHLAANSDVKFDASTPDRDLTQNTLVTARLLDAMRRRKISRLAFSSTSAVYGISPNQPIPESQSCLPISLYGATKLACEAMISAHAHLFGLQAWVFRFANVVGGKVRKSGRTVVSDFIAKLRANSSHLEILGDGKQAKSYVLADECVDAMLHVIHHCDEDYNLFNLGSNSSTSVTRIAELVVTAMGLSHVTFTYTGTASGWPGDVPRFMLDVAALNRSGWNAKHTSEQAIQIAIREILRGHQ